MTQEEKQLLLKDLCARLPYVVKGLHRGQVHELFTIDGREVNNACIQVDGYDAWFSVDTFKPYLRSLSSMTEEEEEEFKQITEIELKYLESELVGHTMESAASSTFEIDFYNSHHFDYRGLIPMGLALEAPEDMYKTE